MIAALMINFEIYAVLIFSNVSIKVRSMIESLIYFGFS